MHLALIVNAERLLAESAMLRRLTLGLADRGIQITAILPETGTREVQPDRPVAAAVLETRLRVPASLRRPRTSRIAATLAGAVPDVIYAVGVESWPLGLDLARALDRALVIDVWSAAVGRRAPVVASGPAVRLAYVVPTEPLAAALRGRGASEYVSVVPMGVESPREPRRVLERREDSITLAFIGTGHDPAGVKAAVEGLSQVIGDLPQIQACLEMRGTGDHDVWRHARKLGVLSHLSTIGHAALHRRLIGGCDVLVVPERAGEVRSIMLESMAAGMPLLAADDPSLDMLVADETALVVSSPAPAEWADKLRRLVSDPQLSQRLGLAARAWVSRHNTVELQVDRLAVALEGALRGGERLSSGL